MALTVAGGFRELAGRLVLTDTQEQDAKDQSASVIAFMGSAFTVAESAFRAGSYRRRSIIRQERDVDVMGPLASSYYRRYEDDSSAFLYWVRGKLNERYPDTKVSSQGLAVHLDFSRITVDVVPCFQRQGGGFLMPNGRRGWQATNPRFHVDMMETANESHGWELKPIVRLSKAWNTDNQHRLASFHIELMVEKVWRYRETPGTTSAAMALTLSRLSAAALEPFPDPWPHGARVDRYLTDSVRRQAASTLAHDAQDAQEAERLRLGGHEQLAYSRWKSIYPTLWPAWG